MENLCKLISYISLLGFFPHAFAKECQVKYGELVDFNVCEIAHLPDFDVQFKGVTAPFEVKTVACWNYQVTSKDNNDKSDFRHCHTGELGGNQQSSVGNIKFTVVFDVRKDCGQKRKSGYVFFSPPLSPKAVLKFQEKIDREQEACAT